VRRIVLMPVPSSPVESTMLHERAVIGSVAAGMAFHNGLKPVPFGRRCSKPDGVAARRWRAGPASHRSRLARGSHANAREARVAFAAVRGLRRSMSVHLLACGRTFARGAVKRRSAVRAAGVLSSGFLSTSARSQRSADPISGPCETPKTLPTSRPSKASIEEGGIPLGDAAGSTCVWALAVRRTRRRGV
jgi:hypothetical protein